eukprot:scaffold12243_cov116-Isochrysis_galbana.AAC.5
MLASLKRDRQGEQEQELTTGVNGRLHGPAPRAPRTCIGRRGNTDTGEARRWRCSSGAKCVLMP